MNHVFISSLAKPLSRWLQAFPDLVHVAPESAIDGADLVWLDAASLKAALPEMMVRLQLIQRRFVVLDAVPDDDAAIKAVQSGACGYAHRHAKPAQLEEIAAVVDAGGLWVGPSVMQKVMQISKFVAREAASVGVDTDLSVLTERELAVAQEVGKGLNNREIAQVLGVTERTVKAHLTVAFEKLAVRDRVQLALLMNGISI
ncbi:MAG: response regulator transcription factor [Candidatus Pelagadaptatus aseana]|uniref:response regulator transcription factor n=1 Tax=Candidatus Pelagadaptatus aseana TaxID=3120508 RepID=UPI0039B14F97